MHWYKKVKKEYYRDDLRRVYNNCEKRPVILTAKYQGNNSINRIIFTNIKPYRYSICESDREKYKNHIFCNHITILRNEINKYLKLNSTYKHKRFLIMVKLIKYKCNGIKRMGVELYNENGVIPIMQISNTRKNNLRKSFLTNFHFYTEEDFIDSEHEKAKIKKSFQIIDRPEEPPEEFNFLQFDIPLTTTSCYNQKQILREEATNNDIIFHI
ncbi:MAG: hypothetical protein FWD40_05560 [Treponema sp.]|nr:hypothetical protein [Treponema sp.]